MKNLLKKVSCKHVVISVVVLLFLSGVIFSNPNGYYYSLAGKSDVTEYYALGKDKKALMSWDVVQNGRSYVTPDRKVKRIANVAIVDSGKFVSIGFGKLSLLIDSKNEHKEYVSLYWRDGDKAKLSFDKFIVSQ